ncbi:MAG: uroporphyrinogen-III synthase [Actinomycetota bacterium]
MSGPLTGRVVLVTRPGEQGASLARRLRDLGADAAQAPTIVVEPAAPAGGLDEAVREAAEGGFAWSVFTSAAGVRAWFARVEALGAGPPRGDVAVVGDATAEALREHGTRPSLVPETFTTEALAGAFPEGSGRVLLARADLAGGDLEEAIRGKGWEPVRVDAYRVRAAAGLPNPAAALLRDGRVDVVTFTSPSTVEGFVRLAGAAGAPEAVCIGPVTADAARAAGLDVAAVAEPHTEDGLVAALIRALTPG